MIFKKITILMLSAFLSSCGGGGGDSNANPLQPDITFDTNSTTVSGGAGMKLIIRNKGSNNIDSVHVDYKFPPGVTIRGGTVGSLCIEVTAGNVTANGYFIDLGTLPPNKECGVKMDIDFSTTGDKTFEVSKGGATGSGGIINKEPFFATIFRSTKRSVHNARFRSNSGKNERCQWP